MSVKAAPRLLAIYLGLALIPLLGGGVNVVRLAVAVAHLFVIALLLRASDDLPGAGGRDHVARGSNRPGRPDEPGQPDRPQPERSLATAFLRWLPLLLVPLLYAELPLLNQVVAEGYRDALVLEWELGIFRGNPAREWAGAMPSRILSGFLHFSYLSYYGLIYLPPLVLWMQGRLADFETTIFRVMLVFTLCFLVFILFPVEGPRYLFPAPEGVPDGFMRGLVLAVLEAGSSRGAAFPSSHMAVAAAQAVLVFRFHSRGAGVLVALLSAGLGVGAIYGGFHYAVDILAGAALGVAAALPYGRAGTWQSPPLAPNFYGRSGRIGAGADAPAPEGGSTSATLHQTDDYAKQG